MTSPFLVAFANHLWQSTLFAAVVGLLMLLLRKNSARVRYALWLAASAKFLVPFALLTVIGAQLPLPGSAARVSGTLAPLISPVTYIAAPITQLGADGATSRAQFAGTADSAGVLLIALGIIWVLGALAVLFRWLSRWREVRRALRDSKETSVEFVIPVRSSSSQLEPGVIGILSPVLLIPAGLEERLTPAQMLAVLAHERCHVTRRDNLGAAFHMLVEAVFWFHPLVWWLGSRLVDERERACDEQVLRDGHAPESYAEGILTVCEHYLESRLPCVAGVGGAHLRQRIEGIMRNPLIQGLNGMRKMVITTAACVAIAAPIAFGILTSPHARAEDETADASGLSFRNVSITLTPADQKHYATAGIDPKTNQLRIHNLPLGTFIADAYGVTEQQIIGTEWVKDPSYDITADVPKSAVGGLSNERRRAMMRDLLTKHFGLMVRPARKQMEGYTLLIAAAGSKLQPHGAGSDVFFNLGPSAAEARGLPLESLVKHLSNRLRAPIVDQTGLAGSFDYKLIWGPPPPPWGPPMPPPNALADPAAIARALEDQLGLHLEAGTVTADVIEVVSVKAPDEVVTKRVAAN